MNYDMPPPTASHQINIRTSPEKVEIFGEGFISTPLYERDIAIAPNGKELMFTLSDYKQSIRSLVVIQKNGTWSSKEIATFSGTYHDIEPFYAPDGKRLFFASNRPIDAAQTRTDYNIWVADKVNGEWSPPKPLNEQINTTGDEFYPSVSKNGNLYFTATRKDGIGREDIYVSEFKNGEYQTPKILSDAINTKTYEFNAYINPQEDLLIFSSYGREDGFGGGDLYYSKKDSEGNWSAAKNLGAKINSPKLDYCPFIDYKNGNFYFTSEKMLNDNPTFSKVSELEDYANRTQNGLGNIYRVSLGSLGI